jgi:hypothetical protein
MVVSLLPKPHLPKAGGDHHFALPTVSPVQRPQVPLAPRTW